MVTKFHRRFGRRRRQAAFPIQMGLILFAAVVLCVLAFVNRNEDPDFDSPTFDFRLGSRRLKPSNKETLGSGESELRWDNWFSLDQMRSGGVIMHVLIMLYMFDGLAIVCDEYFCASLDEIVIKLDLSDDVAGATFMAAGGSAPEFFTSLIGVFFMESSVGFGTIIGSAVFNVLFVIGICAYFSGFDTLPLTWYPLARDSSYYLLCLGALLAVSNDREIHWYEAMILCLLYVGYVVIMMFDPQIRKWAMKNLDRTSKRVTPGADAETKEGAEKNGDGEKKAEEEEDEEEAHDGPPEWPEGAKDRIIYLINAPLTWAMYMTIPDCRVERQKHKFFVTFWASILWIGLLAFVMVTMAADIGDTIGLGDEVMGVTILAIGTSVPDAVSSLLVARDGHGDMALSSSIGSNVFDVTFGLPVPWFIKTAFLNFHSGDPIDIDAKGMSIQVGTLMFMVFAVVATIHLYGWKISRPLGLCYFMLYFVFEAEAIIISQCLISNIDGC